MYSLYLLNGLYFGANMKFVFPVRLESGYLTGPGLTPNIRTQDLISSRIGKKN